MLIRDSYMLSELACKSSIIYVNILDSLREVFLMNKNKTIFKTKLFSLQTLSSLAFAVAIVAANSRCAYIYHNPDKPDELQRLKKF